jgi:hypothetical protein
MHAPYQLILAQIQYTRTARDADAFELVTVNRHEVSGDAALGPE